MCISGAIPPISSLVFRVVRWVPTFSPATFSPPVAAVHPSSFVFGPPPQCCSGGRSTPRVGGWVSVGGGICPELEEAWSCPPPTPGSTFFCWLGGFFRAWACFPHHCCGWGSSGFWAGTAPWLVPFPWRSFGSVAHFLVRSIRQRVGIFPVFLWTNSKISKTPRE